MSFQDGRRDVELVRRLIAAVIDHSGRAGRPRHATPPLSPAARWRSARSGAACVLYEKVGTEISRVGDVMGELRGWIPPSV